MKTKDKENNNILSITQIKIKLSDKKEILLSSEEARQVYEELGKLFKLEEKSEIEKYKELLEEWDEKYEKKIPYIPYPIYIERPAPLDPYYSPWKLPEIWCESNSVNETSWGAPEKSVLVMNLTNNS